MRNTLDTLILKQLEGIDFVNLPAKIIAVKKLALIIHRGAVDDSEFIRSHQHRERTMLSFNKR